jgi:hypothetical protein
MITRSCAIFNGETVFPINEISTNDVYVCVVNENENYVSSHYVDNGHRRTFGKYFFIEKMNRLMCIS